jgi:hypothetical protein
MPQINSALLAIAFALCLATGISQQTTPHPLSQTGVANAGARDTRHANYVGDSACLPCHRDQALSYVHTAHHLTSQPGVKIAILGSFQPPSNVLMIADPATAEDGPGLYFRMDARSDGFYETAVTGWPGLVQERSERTDVVIGSGVRGQSYLYWHGDQLYELPVSFWSDGRRWINSPGYKNGTTDFSRPVDPRCLECHATYIQPLSIDLSTNSYDKKTLATGISCESCHGPGADHVTMHQAKPATGGIPNQAILNPGSFSRDRQVDLCSLCHNGIRQKETEPAFSFVPGQPLDNYLRPIAADTDVQPNVHGDQVGLLKKSRCYLSSPNMSCSTCHNVHAPEQPAASYSAKCLSCHKVESCGMPKTLGHGIANNCIGCHMPVESTSAIVSDTAGQLIRPQMRTHWIKVYR